MAPSGVLSMFSLEGQTAIVTGGSRGIGQAMAIGLAQAGAEIILIQRSPQGEAIRAIEDSLLERRKVHAYVADLSSPDDVAGIIPRILNDGFTPTILVNAAGIQSRHPAHEFPTRAWNDVLQVNLDAVFTLSRDFGAYLLACEPMLPNGRRGSIILLASLLSFQGGLTVPAYAASKGGIKSLAQALSNEWAQHGISVNGIAPGYVDTAMNAALMQDAKRREQILQRIPAGRWGKPEDFKGVVVWLASAASAYVSGETVVVDGGWMGR